MSKEIRAFIKSGAIYKSVKRVRELMKCELCFNELCQNRHIYTTNWDFISLRFVADFRTKSPYHGSFYKLYNKINESSEKKNKISLRNVHPKRRYTFLNGPG